jgi:hypothetical protein
VRLNSLCVVNVKIEVILMFNGYYLVFLLINCVTFFPSVGCICGPKVSFVSSGWVIWAGHVACVAERRDAYRILVDLTE